MDETGSGRSPLFRWTGFVCDTVDDMTAAIGRLHEIDRAVCRAEGERRFSTNAVVDEYEQLYLRLNAD